MGQSSSKDKFIELLFSYCCTFVRRLLRHMSSQLIGNVICKCKFKFHVLPFSFLSFSLAPFPPSSLYFSFTLFSLSLFTFPSIVLSIPHFHFFSSPKVLCTSPSDFYETCKVRNDTCILKIMSLVFGLYLTQGQLLKLFKKREPPVHPLV